MLTLTEGEEMNLIIKDGWTLGETIDGVTYCNCGERRLHKMCAVPPARDYATDFAKMSKAEFDALVVPAPSFQLDKSKDGSVTIVPIK